MKTKSLAAALTLSLTLSLALVAPAAAASDEAQIRSVIKDFMGLVAIGDFAGAAKLRTRKLSPPANGSFNYKMLIRMAGALTKIDNIKVKGDRATATMHFDPKVVKDVVMLIYAEQVKRVKSIQDPKKRAAVLERQKKNKDKAIAQGIKSMTRSRISLQKKDGKWMIR